MTDGVSTELQTPTSSGANEQAAAPVQGTADAATTAPVSTSEVRDTPNEVAVSSEATEEAAPSENPDAYKIPDEYAKEPWASKIKSDQDLWKQLSNAQSLLGKKVLPPINMAEAKPEDLDKHFEAYRPADKKEYDFGEGSVPEIDDVYSNMLFEAGVSAHQANTKIIPAFQKFQQDQLDAATSAEGFKEVMKTSFGDQYDGVVSSVVEDHKKHMSAEDQQMMEAIPNQYLGMVYRLTQAKNLAHAQEIASLKEEYGVTEVGDAHVTAKTGKTNPVDINKLRDNLRNQIEELENMPHTAEQKQDLINQLNKTYE